MVARKALPPQDHVSRFVPKNKQDRDPDTDVYRGLTFAAFALREEDSGGLSLTWIEHYGPDGVDARRAAACAYRESTKSKKIGAQGCFAVATVEQLRSAAEGYRKQVRIVHSPVAGNPGHAEARRFTDEDRELLELLSRDVFTDIDFVSDLGLPRI